ncbi:MAG: FecR family protein [Polyangiaceae bacterium]
MTETRRLAEYVVPKLTDGRLDAQWARIRERDPKPVTLSLRYVYAAAALSVVLGVGFVAGRHFGTKSVMQAAFLGDAFTVEPNGTGQSRLSLPEGITVDIAAGSSLQVRSRTAQETTLELGRGRAIFDVTHRDGRRVVVATPGFDIEVVGTRFLVAVAEGASDAASSQVNVEVLRGTVRVNPSQRQGSSSQQRSLTTGQRWSSTQSVASTEVVEGSASSAIAISRRFECGCTFTRGADEGEPTGLLRGCAARTNSARERDHVVGGFSQGAIRIGRAQPNERQAARSGFGAGPIAAQLPR